MSLIDKEMLAIEQRQFEIPNNIEEESTPDKRSSQKKIMITRIARGRTAMECDSQPVITSKNDRNTATPSKINIILP